ncbi:metallophosphoesterase [Candidatus Pacearchaeota archaeon]|nr:metallophosphoesterase [Candidatus Pacearchaeota archaeon]
MKILIIGDPHGEIGKIRKIPIKKINPDLIFITGDIGKADFIRKFYFNNIERKKKGLKEIDYNASEHMKTLKEIHESTLKVFNYLSKFSSVYTIGGNVSVPNLTNIRKDERKYNTKFPFNTLDEIRKCFSR